jgi:DNA-binding CsgD family transcriptional regulator
VSATATPGWKLSARQLQALTLAADGLTNERIGQRLYVSAWTIKNDLIAVRNRLRARNTAHAVAIAMRNGLLPEAGRPGHRRISRARLTGTGWPT